MIRRIGLAACALVLLAVTTVSAQQVVTGTVVRLDQAATVVVLDNGMMYQATPQTLFLVNNQPTTFAAIAPGTPVVVQYGQPVMFRDGRYVVMAQPAPAMTVVAPAPATTVVAVQPVRTADGAYEVSGVVKYSDSGRRIIRFTDGRNVSIDENVQVLANGSPVMLSTLMPGTFVVVRSSKPLASRDNTYYVVTGPAAGPVVATNAIAGTVVRFDQPSVIVLSDGRVVPATAQTVVMVDNRVVPYATLQPGTQVVIYPNGQAAVVTDPSALPRGPISPGAGLREKEMEHNAP
jgi:hypothetical protein